MGDCVIAGQQIGSSHKFIKGRNAQIGHMLTNLGSHKTEVILHKIGFSPEAFSEFGILGGHTYGTGIEMALPHHHATQYHQGTGCKPKLFGPKQGGDDHIPSGFHLSVRLQYHLASQVIHNQGLLRFCKAYFQGQSSMFDGG